MSELSPWGPSYVVCQQCKGSGRVRIYDRVYPEPVWATTGDVQRCDKCDGNGYIVKQENPREESTR